ncbi:hypothetical protein C3F09_10035 [candidate division GN15 bacterium]|uniref:Uncharacterized protein n=1 Tax=candidate division GN15 bacterium TaxID=2072418 RepID=A0A855WX25_9BACT|nr:MAG: hypothetical protein C3F09_10035 [candidate division GN15 bacterium]
MSDFVVIDCTLLTRMSGLPPAFNLRELRDRIATCSENVLYHHFCETPLRATFDDPEYRNDFAVWARNDLADKILAEKLGIIDPYEIESMADLRRQVIDIIEDRMSELSPWVPAVRPGLEFFFMEALTVAFETGVRVSRPADMADAVRAMTNGSIFFHYLEALKRPPIHKDDFTAWFTECGPAAEPYVKAIAGMDVYFKNLPAIRDSLYRALNAVKEAEH